MGQNPQEKIVMNTNSLYLTMSVLSFMITIALLQLKFTDWLIDTAWIIITLIWVSLYLHRKYIRRSDEVDEKNE